MTTTKKNRLGGGATEVSPLVCEPVDGPPVPPCRIFSAEEIRLWEQQNTTPLPAVNFKALRAAKARRTEAERVRKVAAALSGRRKAS